MTPCLSRAEIGPVLQKNELFDDDGTRELCRVPSYRMADERTRTRTAARAELNDALRAARCSAQLAGMETDDFVVRELLLTLIREIDRAADQARRLYDSA